MLSEELLIVQEDAGQKGEVVVKRHFLLSRETAFSPGGGVVGGGHLSVERKGRDWELWIKSINPRTKPV